MTTVDVLVRGRALAEDAVELKLKSLSDELVLFGRVAEGEHFVARCIVVTVPVELSDRGLVHVRWSRVRDALSMSATGWLLGRVALGSRLVGPLAGDTALARDRLNELGLDWSRSS